MGRKCFSVVCEQCTGLRSKLRAQWALERYALSNFHVALYVSLDHHFGLLLTFACWSTKLYDLKTRMVALCGWVDSSFVLGSSLGDCLSMDSWWFAGFGTSYDGSLARAVFC